MCSSVVTVTSNFSAENVLLDSVCSDDMAGIKVTYKKSREKYPVSVQIVKGGEVTNESQEYRKDEEISWTLTKWVPLW